MDSIHSDVLRVCHPMLRRDLDISHALDFLCAKELFDETDAERIQNEETTPRQISLLLQILKRKGPSAYEIFKECLWDDCNQRHLREQLLQQEEQIRQLESQKLDQSSMDMLVSSLKLRYKEEKDGVISAQEIEQDIQTKMVSLPRQLDCVSLTFLRVLVTNVFPKSELRDTVLSVSDDKPSYPWPIIQIRASCGALCFIHKRGIIACQQLKSSKVGKPIYSRESPSLPSCLKLKFDCNDFNFVRLAVFTNLARLESLPSNDTDDSVAAAKSDVPKEEDSDAADKIEAVSPASTSLHGVADHAQSQASEPLRAVPPSGHNMDTWSEIQVCQWLARIGIDKECVVNKVQQEKISGEILHYMDSDELKEVFGEMLRFGERKRIMIERERFLEKMSDSPAAESSCPADSYLAQPANVPFPSSDFMQGSSNTKAPTKTTRSCTVALRAFEHAHDGLMYPKGLVVNVPIAESGNLIEPLHRLIVLDLTKKKNLLIFGTAIMQFACACLNERRNGTLHVGIDPMEESGASQGRIVGTALMKGKTINDYEQYIDKMAACCFLSDQILAVKSCVREPKFVEVEGDGEPRCYVIESDVVPNVLICGDEAFYFKAPTSGTKDDGKVQMDRARIYHFSNGVPCIVSKEDLCSFMSAKEELFQRRKQQEGIPEPQLFRKDLRDKMVHLLCQGEQTFTGDTYPILAINKPAEHMDQLYLKDSLSFLSDIPWKAVFDFDSEATICDFLRKEKAHMVRVMESTDAFHERSTINLQDPEKLHKFQESLTNSIQQPWIFSNGYSAMNQEPKDPFRWKQTRREGFKDAVRFFGNAIPAGRAMVVFCLLSQEWEVMLEAAEEFLSTFPNYWMCIVEEEDIASPWMNKLLERHSADETTLKDQMIIGMPWQHVQRTVSELQGPRKTGRCELPCSYDTFCLLKESVKNDLFELDILGRNECENVVEVPDRQESQDNYYKGKEVDWWNFQFDGQVCKRRVHKRLKRQVENALSKKVHEEGLGQHVGRVVLYHQPGAGATTVAKHVMWELKKAYRCATVKSVSDTAEVCKQIMTLRSYKDPEHPKPVVLFLDNQDEEKTNLLWAHLEENAKRITRDAADPVKVICVLLLCLRRPTLPKNASHGCLVLKHELDEDEQKWFQKKHLELSKNSLTDKKQMNLKHMLSFNIMKENFDSDFIDTNVSSLLKGVQDDNERKLLKYIALLNAYDLGFRGVPTAAFDEMMFDWSLKEGKRGRRTVEYGIHHLDRRAFDRRWEKNLSDAFLVFMNETKVPVLGMIHSLRITNHLLSATTLRCLMKTDGNEMISDVVLQLLNDKDVINGNTGMAKKELFKLINDVLKSRRRDVETGKPETEFAPIIEDIREIETSEKATEVLEAGYALASDPFVAQQLARLYMKDQNWDAALSCIDKATHQRPDNSYLWDTYGRVYERQLAVKSDLLKTGSTTLTAEDAQKVIETAMRGIDKFRKVQATSERETAIASNDAGYFGEIDVVLLLLDSLSYMEEFADRNVFHRFLVEESYDPFEEDYLHELKTLHSGAKSALKRLEDERLQLREEVVDEYRRSHQRTSNSKLVRIKKNLASYFGEDREEIPEGISEEATCDYRRRRILSLGGNTLLGIFDLAREEGGEEKLCELRQLTLDNVKGGYGQAEDYETLIGATFALLRVDERYIYEESMQYNLVVEWSRKLYQLRKTQNYNSLEPYLFYTMINWPGRGKEEAHTVSSAALAEVLKQWRDAYYKKYPRQKEEGKPYRKKDTTVFFLGNGSGLHSITTYADLRKITDMVGDAFWDDPFILRTLKRFEGILCDEGREVQLRFTGERLQTPIAIATSMPISRRTWWNRPVFFAIGFSWVGPKAFDVKPDDPTEDIEYMVQGHRPDDPTQVSNKNRKERLRATTAHLQRIDVRLAEIERIEYDLRHGKRIQRFEREILRDKEELKRKKRELTESRQRLSIIN